MEKMQCEYSRKMKQPETNKGPMEVFELSQRVSSDALWDAPTYYSIKPRSATTK